MSLFAAAALGTMLLSAQAAPANPGLGINLNGIVSYGTEIPFTDLFKTACGWISQAPGQPFGKGPPLALDAYGWVKGLAGGGNVAEAIFCPDAGIIFGGKTLTCFYDGDGLIDFPGNARVVARAPGRVAFQVLPKPGSLTLVLKRTNPANPVRNISVVQPGFERVYRHQPFSPAFVKRWSQFQVLRFMDWQSTNNSLMMQWADRSVPIQNTQVGPKGVCLEYMIALANATGSNPWFCMPHRATDDFVRNFAAMVKRDLHPSLKVYVEYSNECWNGMFAQAKYCQQEGLKFNLSKDPYQAQLKFYALRSIEIFKMWEGVLGDKTRLVRVLAAQAAVPATGNTILSTADAAKNADAIAIAPYFGYSFGSPNTAQTVAAMSVPALLEGCRASIAQVRVAVQAYSELAQKNGLRLLAYEGGQHLVGFAGAENNDQLAQLFIAANRDPGMKDLYLEHLGAWHACGGDVFCLFSSMSSYGKFGSWGLLEHEFQNPAAAPKYTAALEFLASLSSGH
jgi:hypothetical protein